MFARRASWDLERNALTQRLEARRAAGLPIFDLTDTNPTTCGLEAPALLARAALTKLSRDPRAARYEPDARGHAEARAAVAAYHRERGAALDAEHVVLTAGTSEGYAHLFRLLADPGDHVLVPRPGYPLFDFLAGLEAVETRSYPLRLGAEGWRIDLEALERAVDERTRAILVVHPHNPTGSFLRHAEAAAIRALCAERGLALVSDEVFADYAFEPARDAWPGSLLEDPGPGPGADCLRFVLSGVSKLLGLPQWKVAWIAAAGPAPLRDEALARLELIADTYLSVNTPAQLALRGLLARRDAVQQEIRARVRGNRRALAEPLAPVAGVDLLPADGGWAAIVRLGAPAWKGPVDEDQLVTTLLDESGVLVHPGYFFELEASGDERAAHLVLSLLIPEQVLRRVVPVLIRPA